MYRQLVAECCREGVGVGWMKSRSSRLLLLKGGTWKGFERWWCTEYYGNSIHGGLMYSSTINKSTIITNKENMEKQMDEKGVTPNILEESKSFEQLLESNQFHKIKLYIGKSQDKQLIKDYLQFLEANPSIRVLNIKLDSLAKKDKHSLSEPIFKRLIYFLTHIDIDHLKSMNVLVLRPNNHTFNIMMMNYLTVGDIDTVQSLFDSISIWTQNLPNYVTFVTLLTAYCRVGNLKTVNELFAGFIEGKIRLRQGLDNQEAVTSIFTVLMTALVDIGKLSKVEEIYQKFLTLSLTPSQHMKNIMLNVYKKRKNYQKCVEMFEDYQKSYPTDRYIIHTMISVYGYMGKFEEMEKLFSTIEKPNDFTYILMTGAYCSAGLEVQAEKYFSHIVNVDDKIQCKMMQMYSDKRNIEKLELTFFLRKPSIPSIYIYIDGISNYGNYEKVNELVRSIPQELYTGNIWVCHLQSAVKTKFTDPDQYLERVNNVFFKKPNTISGKDNKFGIKLYKLALGLKLSAHKSKPTTQAIEKPITEIYREFAEQKVKLAMDGVDEGKFQTRDSFHEQFVLNNDSIYRPDYVSPYEAFLEGYHKKKVDSTILERDDFE